MSIPVTNLKYSPAESAMSLPMEAYSPLFSSTAMSTPNYDVGNPMESQNPLSPASMVDGRESRPEDVVLAALAASLAANDIATALAGSSTAGSTETNAEKKPVKKRKSWGQVLPEPKTNLPPRKRAKTADEKEQRRVERVLRNRRAAQSSRERKRLEVEALERRNKELEARISLVERANQLLLDKLKEHNIDASSALPKLEVSTEDAGLERLMNHSVVSGLEPLSEIPSTTVDPASLSPVPITTDTIKSIATKQQKQPMKAEPEPMEIIMAMPATTGKPADLTQRPAEMLCDLQCQSAGRQLLPMAPFLVSHQPSLLNLLTASSVLLSVCKMPLTQIALSLKTSSPLPPTPQILRAIMWLVTRPSTRTSIISMTLSSLTSQMSSTLSRTVQASQRTRRSRSASRTLRIKSLHRILTSSPSLARPLQDATMAVLRFVTQRDDDTLSPRLDQPSSDIQREDLPNCFSSWEYDTPLPSKEALLTLLWILRLEEKRHLRDATSVQD